MFKDPRSGVDRRNGRGADVTPEAEQRKTQDRRADEDPASTRRWWLLRRYVNIEWFFGGRKDR